MNIKNVSNRSQAVIDLQITLFKHGIKAGENEVNEVITKGIDTFLYKHGVELTLSELTNFYLIINTIKN